LRANARINEDAKVSFNVIHSLPLFEESVVQLALLDRHDIVQRRSAVADQQDAS
jgi:hypothetical protein